MKSEQSGTNGTKDHARAQQYPTTDQDQLRVHAPRDGSCIQIVDAWNAGTETLLYTRLWTAVRSQSGMQIAHAVYHNWRSLEIIFVQLSRATFRLNSSSIHRLNDRSRWCSYGLTTTTATATAHSFEWCPHHVQVVLPPPYGCSDGDSSPRSRTARGAHQVL